MEHKIGEDISAVRGSFGMMIEEVPEVSDVPNGESQGDDSESSTNRGSLWGPLSKLATFIDQDLLGLYHSIEPELLKMESAFHNSKFLREQIEHSVSSHEQKLGQHLSRARKILELLGDQNLQDSSTGEAASIFHSALESFPSPSFSLRSQAAPNAPSPETVIPLVDVTTDSTVFQEKEKQYGVKKGEKGQKRKMIDMAEAESTGQPNKSNVKQNMSWEASSSSVLVRRGRGRPPKAKSTATVRFMD